MHGPQDMTLADRANDASRGMWLALGGQELVHASLGWYRVLRPGATAQALLGSRRGGERRPRGPSVRAPGSRVGPSTPWRGVCPRSGRPSSPPSPRPSPRPSRTRVLLEQVAAAAPRLRLHPEYDAAYLDWMFGELDALRELRGRRIARLVRGTRGQVLGWYVYLLPEGGIAHAVQVGVPNGGIQDGDAVIDHLFRDAWAEGAAAVHGRIEPALSGLITRPGVIVRKTARALVHAEDPTILALLGSPRALLSQLDGEWLVAHGGYV